MGGRKGSPFSSVMSFHANTAHILFIAREKVCAVSSAAQSLSAAQTSQLSLYFGGLMLSGNIWRAIMSLSTAFTSKSRFAFERAVAA